MALNCNRTTARLSMACDWLVQKIYCQCILLFLPFILTVIGVYQTGAIFVMSIFAQSTLASRETWQCICYPGCKSCHLRQLRLKNWEWKLSANVFPFFFFFSQQIFKFFPNTLCEPRCVKEHAFFVDELPYWRLTSRKYWAAARGRLPSTGRYS